MPAKKSAPIKKPRASRKKPQAGSRGLPPADVAQPGPGSDALAADIASDGGSVLARYRDPLGGHDVILAALPIEKVAPTPYQRDLSDAHVKRLTGAVNKLDRFLDPIITVRHEGQYWTPNGHHRLATMRSLGAKAITSLVLPEPDVAYQILALNTEKAHNLKERSLEVIRMVRGLTASDPNRQEVDAAAMLEEPSFITIGACYEKRPRFSGSAYHPMVKRCETFFEEKFKDALPEREARADKLLAVDDLVAQRVQELKAKGFDSPYLKSFVVARANPIRFAKGSSFDFDETVDKMRATLEKMDLNKVKREDIARAGGYGGGGGEGED